MADREIGGWDAPVTFSVALTELLVFWFVSVLAVLTVFTHFAQVFSIVYAVYAYLSILIALLVSIVVLRFGWKSLPARAPTDIGALLCVLALGLMGAFLAVSFHRIGRTNPDEYYYLAAPNYFVQHPQAHLDFQVRTFFTGGSPVFSASLLTAGAYEYIQSIVAYLGGYSLATIYYMIFGGINGFLIPISLFLLIYMLHRNVAASIIGSFVATATILLAADTLSSPYMYSFMRVFEGKSFLLFSGVPLLAGWSLAFFMHPTRWNWARIFALSTAVVGMSTTALPLLLILAPILILSFGIGQNQWRLNQRIWAGTTMRYFVAFAYLPIFILVVLRIDKFSDSLRFNGDFPASFSSYALGFINGRAPLTVVIGLGALAVSLVFLKDAARRFIGAWVGLLVALVLNPLMSQFWLRLFPGIFFRFFYAFSFQAAPGILAGALYLRWQGLAIPLRRSLTATACVLPVALNFVLPMTMARNPSVAWGSWLQDQDFQRAAALQSTVPSGLMLAPYPLSGAVTMINSFDPQMITRNDIMNVYLGEQNRSADAIGRQRVEWLLTGASRNVHALTTLLRDYPEIQSVVFYRKGWFYPIADSIDKVMKRNGFSNYRRVMDLAVYSKPEQPSASK